MNKYITTLLIIITSFQLFGQDACSKFEQAQKLEHKNGNEGLRYIKNYWAKRCACESGATATGSFESAVKIANVNYDHYQKNKEWYKTHYNGSSSLLPNKRLSVSDCKDGNTNNLNKIDYSECQNQIVSTNKDPQRFISDYMIAKCMCEKGVSSDVEANKLYLQMKDAYDSYKKHYVNPSIIIENPKANSCPIVTFSKNGNPESYYLESSNNSTAKKYEDPNENIKSSATNFFNTMAEESGNERIKRVANNCNNVRDYAQKFKDLSPEYKEQIDKIEDYSMMVGVIAPFIFKSQMKQEEEMAKARAEKNALRSQDGRVKEFEKKILIDVLTVKEYMLKEYAKGNKKKYNEYFEAYLTLLNTPIAMYDANELMYQFYSDVNTNQPWTTNMKLYPFDKNMENKLASYQLNTTVGAIYYGGSGFISKKLLDLLFYQTSFENVNDTEILNLLKKYKLYSGGSERFDYQPFLFALNYANETNNNKLLEDIWAIIDTAYHTEGNTVEDIKVSTKMGEQKKHLKSIGYKASAGTVGMLTYSAKIGIFKSMSYAILKRRYDFIKEAPIDNNYTTINIVYTYAAFYMMSPVNVNLFFSTQLEQAYFLQLMLENTYNDIEIAIKNEDKKSFLSSYKAGIKIYKPYEKFTNGKNDKKKSNYFKPVYHEQSTVYYISSMDFIKHAKPMASLERAYKSMSNSYTNSSVGQDTKMVNTRVFWYNAWADYFRTGSKDQINAFPTKFMGNPYAQLEWLISYGETIK